MSKRTIADLDLTPRGVTEVDLHGRTTAAEWRPFGCTFTTRALFGNPPAPWTPEAGEAARADYADAERAIRASTRAMLTAWLEARGHTAWRESKAGLVTRCLIAVNEARFPRVFVRERET